MIAIELGVVKLEAPFLPAPGEIGRGHDSSFSCSRGVKCMARRDSRNRDRYKAL